MLYKKLHPTAIPPFRATPGSVGYDLSSLIDVWVPTYRSSPGEIPTMIPTGIAIELPPGCEGQIRLRSSLGKVGLVIPNSPATIDTDYRGELMIMVYNFGYDRIIKRGARVAQLVVAAVYTDLLVEAEELTPTERGTGGFGSTGGGS